MLARTEKYAIVAIRDSVKHDAVSMKCECTNVRFLAQ